MTKLPRPYRHVESISEHRLLCRNVEVLPKHVLETFLQSNPDVEKLEQAVGTLDEQSPVYQAMLERSKTLSEQQCNIINMNCQRLREQAKERAETLRKISLLQNGINASRQTPSAPAATTEKNGLAGAWEWTKEKTQAGWEHTKGFAKEHPTLTIAVGSTLGVALIYKLWKWWRGDKKKEGEAEKKEGEKPAKRESLFWRAAKWIPGVGLMALAGWGIYEGVQWMRKNFGSWDQAKDWMARMEHKIKAGLGFEGKGKKYGISDEEYDRAEQSYDTLGETAALPEIRALFGFAEKGETPQYAEFLADMRQKYETKKLPEGTVTYQRIDVALAHYEQQLELGIRYLIKWIEDHPAEVIGAGLIAAKLGVLLPILKGSGSAAKKAVEVTTTIASWGFKQLLHHPFFSLFAIGGGILAARRSVAAGKELFLPENLQALGQACVRKEPVVLGVSEAISGVFNDLRDHAVNLAMSSGTFGPWLQDQLTDFIAKLDEAIPRIIGGSDEQIIENQNRCGIHSLRFWLQADFDEAGRSDERKKAGDPIKLKKALETLDTFEEVFVAERGKDVPQSDGPERAFEALKPLLREVGISLDISGGIVRWQHAQEPQQQLCTDPRIRDRDELLRLAEEMQPGEENALNYFLARVGRYVRRRQREAHDKLGNVWGSETVGMVLGNAFFFTDLIDDAATVCVVPFTSVADVVTTLPGLHRLKGESWSNVAAENASGLLTGIADTGLLSLPFVAFSRLKRIAVGGGYVFKLGGKWSVLKNMTPGVAEYFWMRNAYRGALDVRLVKNFMSEQGTVRGYFAGRRLNSIFARAAEGEKIMAIRPEWVGMLESATTFDELDTVAAKLHVSRPDRAESIAAVRKSLKDTIIARLKKSRVRQLSRKNFGVRMFLSDPIGDEAAEAAYKDAARLCRSRAGAPSPHPTGPKTSPATPKNPGGKAPTSPSGNPAQGPRSGSTTPAGGPQTQPASARTTGTGTAQAERMPGAGRTRSVGPGTTTPAHELVSPEAAARFVDKHGDVGEAIEQAAANAKRLDALKASDKVRNLLKTVPLNTNLQKALDESPEFARILFRHLDSVDDPAKLLRTLNASADVPEHAALLGRVMQSEKGFARALKVVDGGGDLVSALSKTSRVMRVLKGAGRVAPVVIDVAVIFGTVCEMIETAEIIDQQKQKNVSPEVIRLTEQRYYYQAAQLGVSGVGFIAGGCLIVGVGGTVALPLVLATLPVSAVIYGAYEGHKWKEAQERTAEDWHKEFDIIALLTDVRTYSFGERTGHAWELSNMSLWTLAVPGAHVWQQGSELYTLVSGGREEQIKDLFRRIQEVDRKKIRAVVAHTTTVTIPEVVTGDDGQPRDLYPTEVKQYQQELDRYVEAKVEYILSRRQDAAHAIKSYGNITDLLEESEAAGLLAKDRPVLEKRRAELQRSTDPAARGIAAQLGEILDETDLMKQAQLYQKYLRRKQTDELYGGLSVYLAMQSPQQRKAQYHQVEQVIASTVLSNAKQTYVNYCMRSAEDNIKGGLDGDSPRIVRMYAMEQVKTLAREKGSTLTRQLMSDAKAPRDQGVWEFQEVLQDAQREVERLLADPASTWQSMSTEDKERLGYGFTPRDQVSEKYRPKIEAGEALMRRINANVNGHYYTKEYGTWINKYLYITFDEEQGKWLADLGSLSDLQDPAAFCCNMYGGSGAYNRLLEDLDAINHGKEPSQ
ncbi:MAG: hypothetical protein ABIG34_05610 [Candidatus Peregrinibacteria bacterium]